VWIFGDNIDTDNIFPTRFGADPTPQVMGTHVFIDHRPDFNQNAKEGDFVLAGHNFGYGSYRETAATGLRGRGIRVVIARSFARAYYRNAINLGMYPLIIGDVDFDFTDGDRIGVDPETGVVINLRTHKQYRCVVPSGLGLDIIKAGGATEYFKPMVQYPEKSI
jgi:3-isopropylmalate/(R)-2-methylmalate dehydratase small subunit